MNVRGLSLAVRRGCTILQTRRNQPSRHESAAKAIADIQHYLADDGYPPAVTFHKPRRKVRSGNVTKSRNESVDVPSEKSAANVEQSRASLVLLVEALKKRDFKLVMKYWKRRPELNLNAPNYTELLKICVVDGPDRKGNLKGAKFALKIFDGLLETGLPLDASSCESVAKACGMIGNPTYLNKVASAMHNQGLMQSHQWRSSRIKAYARHGKFMKEANAEYAKMRQAGIFGSPSMYKALVIGHVRYNHSDQATRVLQDMASAGFPLSRSLCLSVLNTAIEQIDARSLRLLTKWYMNLNGQLDRGTCQALLNVAARRADAKLTLDIWATMEDLSYELTPAAYEAVILALGGARDDASLIGALVEMELKGGIVPSTGLINAVAATLASSVKRIDDVYYLLEQMNHDKEVEGTGRTVTLAAVNGVIGACAVNQDLNRTFSTFEDLKRVFHMKPDALSYKFLLQVCSLHRNGAEPDAALLVLEDMEKTGLEPDEEAYRYLLLSLARGNRLAKMDDVMERLNYDGRTDVLTAQTLSSLAHHFAFAGDDDRARSLHAQISMLDYHVPSHLSHRIGSQRAP